MGTELVVVVVVTGDPRAHESTDDVILLFGIVVNTSANVCVGVR
jgi:hypothetical protein